MLRACTPTPFQLYGEGGWEGGLKISEMYFRNVFAVDLFWSNLLLMFLPILDYGEGGGYFCCGSVPHYMPCTGLDFENYAKLYFDAKHLPGISGNWVVKSKLPPRSGRSLEAVEPHPQKGAIKFDFFKFTKGIEYGVVKFLVPFSKKVSVLANIGCCLIF